MKMILKRRRRRRRKKERGRVQFKFRRNKCYDRLGNMSSSSIVYRIEDIYIYINTLKKNQ